MGFDGYKVVRYAMGCAPLLGLGPRNIKYTLNIVWPKSKSIRTSLNISLQNNYLQKVLLQNTMPSPTTRDRVRPDLSWNLISEAGKAIECRGGFCIFCGCAHLWQMIVLFDICCKKSRPQVYFDGNLFWWGYILRVLPWMLPVKVAKKTWLLINSANTLNLI